MADFEPRVLQNQYCQAGVSSACVSVGPTEDSESSVGLYRPGLPWVSRSFAVTLAIYGRYLRRIVLRTTVLRAVLHHGGPALSVADDMFLP